MSRIKKMFLRKKRRENSRKRKLAAEPQSKLAKRLYLCAGIACILIATGIFAYLIRYYYLQYSQEQTYASLREENTTQEEVVVVKKTVTITDDDGEIIEEEEEEVYTLVSDLELLYRYYEDVYEIEIPRLNIDFFKLQNETNSDIYAWIYIPNTNVDYPILQHATQEQYYLMHNLDRSYGYPGCIYSEFYNSKTFTDFNTILYGHNMKNETMFGSLKWYTDTNFFYENQYYYIYMPNDIIVCKIFRAYRYYNKYLLYYFDMFSEEGSEEYLEEIKTHEDEMSNVDTALLESLTTSDHIVTLSTCIYGEEESRYLVQAKILEDPAASLDLRVYLQEDEIYNGTLYTDEDEEDEEVEEEPGDEPDAIIYKGDRYCGTFTTWSLNELPDDFELIGRVGEDSGLDEDRDELSSTAIFRKGTRLYHYTDSEGYHYFCILVDYETNTYK